METSTPQLAKRPTATAVEAGWYLSGCITSDQSITRIPIDSESFVIGRRPGLSLSLPSPRVSGRHAEILLIGENLLIRDLGSTNGTYVNRRRVTRATPIGEGDHIELADVEFRLEYDSQTRPQGVFLDPSLRKTAKAIDSFEPDWILSQFKELIEQEAVTPHYQPIIQLSDDSIFGYEALARSNVSGLTSPAAMFQTAQLVDQEVELSMLCRRQGVASAVKRIPDGTHVFLNTHPRENLRGDVCRSVETLRKNYPDIPLTIEIHEGAIDDPARVQSVMKQLDELDVQIAYDDFGAGQSRLLELVEAPPDFLKFDACLVRNSDRASSHQWKLLNILVQMAHDFGALTIAEGVETGAEAEACRDLGFDYAQGYYFGRPAPLPMVESFTTQIGF